MVSLRARNFKANVGAACGERLQQFFISCRGPARLPDARL
jgi:hypothetical protein